MIRGTTPKHYFDSPCDVAIIDKVNLIYKQDDKLVLKKVTKDFVIEGNTISTRLTREESLKFNDETPAKVQAIILTLGGDVIESFAKSFGIDELLDDGEIE